MRIELEVKHELDRSHYVELTNNQGDTYTSRSEELINFLIRGEGDNSRIEELENTLKEVLKHDDDEKNVTLLSVMSKAMMENSLNKR